MKTMLRVCTTVASKAQYSVDNIEMLGGYQSQHQHDPQMHAALLKNRSLKKKKHEWMAYISFVGLCFLNVGMHGH